MHTIQDLFLEGFSYILQIDMHFICAPMWTKFYSCKKWVLQSSAGASRPWEEREACLGSRPAPARLESHSLVGIEISNFEVSDLTSGYNYLEPHVTDFKVKRTSEVTCLISLSRKGNRVIR
jgi:hypothetical protein